MSKGKKKKINSEHKVVNTEWTNKYLFVTNEDQAICLICRETVAVPKEYNSRRHLKTQHPTIARLDRLDGNQKSLKADSLIKSLSEEQQFFKIFDNESAKATNVSSQISREIAASEKCFTDGDFVKNRMLLAVS